VCISYIDVELLSAVFVDAAYKVFFSVCVCVCVCVCYAQSVFVVTISLFVFCRTGV
jgi:hypothetical protein